MKTLSTFKKELLKDDAIQKGYAALAFEFKIVQTIIQKRLEEGLTQAELAKRVGTKQSAISRFESGNYNPSLNFLAKLAKALELNLQISVSKK